MVKHFGIPVALIASLVCINISWARVINVPADYGTIQAGIDAAVNGDTVLVAPGIYGEVIDDIQIESKNILLTTSSNPDSCQIRGSINIRGQIDTTCIIRGFKVSPIRIYDCSPIIEGNIIFGYWGDVAGGVRLTNSNGIVRSNIITDNIAVLRGGGIYASGNPVIEKNIISHNSAAAAEGSLIGGGIFLASGIVRHNLIMHNGASVYYGGAAGGGVYIDSGPSSVINNTIIDNGAWGQYNGAHGGGISFSVRSRYDQITIKNNIIAFNRPPEGIRAYIGDTTWTGWDYNLVFGNDSLNYVGLAPGTHDIQADPMFVDTDSGNYHLLPNSPCIDAGDPNSPLDPDGTRADIGAYYFDQAVGIDEPGPSGPYHFSLAQSYPNPFNAQTVISYSLDKDAAVSLLVYSITGQRVNALAKAEPQPAGEHRYVWDGTDGNGKPVGTGIYFYELHVDDYKESKAMILMK
jgi:hypothetical protein